MKINRGRKIVTLLLLLIIAGWLGYVALDNALWHPEGFQAQAFMNSFFGLLLVLVLLHFAWRAKFESTDPNDLLQDMIEHEDDIKMGKYFYRGHRIKTETVLVSYQTAISIIIATQKSSSRFYVVDHDRTALIGYLYSLGTFLFGWWGIPFGPIYTVQALATNVKGGRRVRVGDLFR